MCLPPVSEREVVPDAVALSMSNNNKKMTQATHEPEKPSQVSFLSRRLVFFGAAESQPEPALQRLFSQYGEVADMFIVRSALGISSGCGYVTFTSAQHAMAALQGLQGTNECADPGTTLGVLLVTDAGSSSSGAAAGDSSAASETCRADSAGTQSDSKVFFTKVPPTVTSQQLIQLFTACGDVAHLELFIPWPGAKISRGCGLVEFTSSAAAAAAVHSLHQQFTWPHSHSALVVEWVDRNRQGNNKANKARTAIGSCTAGSPTNPPGMSVLGADQQTFPSSWRPAHGMGLNRAFAAAESMPQQQLQQLRQQAAPLARSSHSCPLPQLPPGWQVIGTAQQLPPAARMARPAAAGPQWAQMPGQMPAPLNNTMPMQLSQQQAPAPAGAYMQQGGTGAPAGDASNGPWMACPIASSTLSSARLDLSSLTSLGSVYDASVLSSSIYSSANNSGALQSQFVGQGSQVLDLSGQDLAACTAGTSGSTGLNAVLASSAGFSEPMMSVQGAGGMSGNSADAVWQQLLQQNVMLLQTMTPPPEEEQLLLPSAAASQAPSMQASSIVAISGGFTGAAPAYMPLSQAQQVQTGPVLYTSNSALQAQQQQQRQVWYMPNTQMQVPAPQQQQQPGQAAGGDSVVVALPLTQRQLAAMAGVLPEVPRWTGAQAWISSAASGGLQLCMSGTYTQLQAGHTAVAMLLGKAGVDEPLAPAMVHAAAN